MVKSMEKKTQEELWADWVATQNIARYQDLLKHEKDQRRYKLLEGLIADEHQKFNRAPHRLKVVIPPD